LEGGGFGERVGKGEVSLQAEVGKVTLKSNGDEALSDEFLLKSNGNEALNDVFSIKSNGDEAFNAKKKL
jgi:hypothetical protein